MNGWYIYQHHLCEHHLLAILANLSKLQTLEVVKGILIWLWISRIKQQLTHSIPPYCPPVLSTANAVSTTTRMLHLGRFCSDDTALFIQKCLYIDQCHENIMSHESSVGVLNTCPWGYDELVKPQRKKLHNFVFNSEMHEFRWMELELSVFDLGDNEFTGVWTAIKLAGELEEILEL